MVNLFGLLTQMIGSSWNALENIVTKLSINRKTEVLLVGYVEEYAENIKKEKIPYFDGDSENALPYYLQWRKGFCGMVLGYVYSRTFLLDNQITFPEHVFFEDVAFNAKACHFAKNIQMVPKVLYHYNKANETSITKKYSKRKIQDLMEGYDAIKRFMEAENILLKYQKFLISRFIVFGLSGGFRMYFNLSRKDKKDAYFKREFLAYRNLSFFSQKTLTGIQATVESFDNHESELKEEYKRNLAMLWWVKNAFSPLKFLIWVASTRRKLKAFLLLRMFF